MVHVARYGGATGLVKAKRTTAVLRFMQMLLLNEGFSRLVVSERLWVVNLSELLEILDRWISASSTGEGSHLLGFLNFSKEI